VKRVLCFFFAGVLSGLFLIPSSFAADNHITNIYLFGTDGVEGRGYSTIGEDDELGRADAIFILSLHKQSGHIKLLNIERDYMAIIPDGVGENKVSTATYYGGPELATKVINNMFDLDIGLYVQINVESLIRAVDIFGGVDVEILPDEVDKLNSFIASIQYAGIEYIQAGINHLNGHQAWAMMAVRDLEAEYFESGIQRSIRQQRVFKAILEQSISQDIGSLTNFAFEILPLVQTNISVNDLLKLIETARSLNPDYIEYKRTPSGSFRFKSINMHRVVIPDDMAQEIDSVHAFLSGM